MANTQTTTTYSLYDNEYANLLLRPDVQRSVIDSSFNFNTIRAKMYEHSGDFIECDSLVKFFPYLGNTAISFTVGTSATTSGSNLLLSLPIGDNRYREKDVLLDVSTMVFARIITISGTTATLIPMGTALVANTHFAAGATVSNFANATINEPSLGVQGLSQTFSQDTGVLSKRRDAICETIEDHAKTEVMYHGESWWASQQPLLAQRAALNDEYDIVFSEKLVNNAQPDGTLNRMGGIRWTAKQPRSTYFDLNTAPVRNDIENFVVSMTSKMASIGQDTEIIDAYVGSNMLLNIQRMLAPTIQYAGVNSTFGMQKESGFNVWIYPVAGATLRLQKYPLFNNRGLFGNIPNSNTQQPRMESTMMAINWGGAKSVNTTDHIPTISRMKKRGISNKIMRTNPGFDVYGLHGGEITYSELDATSYHMYTYEGAYIIPELVGWMELL